MPPTSLQLRLDNVLSRNRPIPIIEHHRLPSPSTDFLLLRRLVVMPGHGGCRGLRPWCELIEGFGDELATAAGGLRGGGREIGGEEAERGRVVGNAGAEEG